jgi:predicted nucleic acid-binding Zn ribbon protein
MKNPRKVRTNPEAVPVSDIVSRLLQQKGWSRGWEHRAVFEAWEKIVPETIGNRSRAVSFRNGKLIVVVESAPLLQELRCFRQAEFLALMNSQLVTTANSTLVRRLEFRRA